MTVEEVKAAIHIGCPISCTKEEWPALRTIIQDLAGKYIDNGDGVRALIALEEVKRLDSKFED